jgi:hypothetical protein
MSIYAAEEILLWAIVFIIITIVIFYFLIYYQIVNIPNTVVDALSSRFDKNCEFDLPLGYREAVYIPETNGIYEKKLANALLDVSFMTSSANCPDILPLENPPGFDNQLRICGFEPVSGINTFIGYIFWNRNTGQAIISFSGTETKQMWQADIRYHQVPPTQLNGYVDGMLAHEGFYGVYMSIRSQLWEWWNNNSSWVSDLYITGHSLGGALSCLATFDFSDVLVNKKPIHYAYAAPRVGNVLFAQEYKKRMPTSLIVLNNDDIVPQLILSQLFSYTYESLQQIVPFSYSGGSLSYNHINSYYYNLPDEPVCAK